MENKKIKILAIDDNNDNLISLKALIKEAFPDSIRLTALNGAAGLDLAQAEDPDVILLDVVMPGMDGFEVCQKLKANLKTSNIPVVFVTALKGDKQSRIRALEVGAEAFLAKPIDEAELTAQVRAMLKIKEANDQKLKEKEHLTQLVKDQTREIAQNYTATLNLLDDLQEENEARKKGETTLRESEEKFSMIFRKAPFSAALSSISDLKIVEVNEQFEKYWGYSSVEVIGKTFSDLGLHPDNNEQARLSAIFQEKGFIHGIESRMKSKSGELKDVLINSDIVMIGHEQFMLSTVQNITERKQAEEKQAQTYELLTNLARLVPGVIYQYRLYPDGSSAFPYSSPGMYSIYEVTPEQVREDATLVFGRLHPEDADRLSDLIFESARTLEEFYCEYRVILPEQGLRWRWSQAHPERTEDGGTLWHGIISDITERKQAEEALSASQQLSESIIESIPGTFYMLDEAGKYVRWSAYQRDEIIGKPDDQIAGFSAIDTIHPDDRALIQARIENVLRTGVVETIEGRVLLRGGPKFQWLLMTGRQLVVAEHPYLVGIGIDISERKQAEEKLKENSLQLQLAMQSANMAWWEMDITSGQVTFEKRKAEMLGYAPEKFHHYNDFVALLHPEDNEKAMDAMRKHIEGSLVKYEAEYRMLNNSGEYKWFYDIGAIVKRDLKGNPLNVAGLVMDISERKQAEEALQKSSDELRLAYDSTLQGWSKALELREHETAGHSQRVVHVTLELAREMGVKEEELVHIQRGSLLHDIGKMGIPDSILLKPGPLSENEWCTMRLHPVFAYQLLSNIPYLEPALDIPHYHHEKWDGSGYPCGLQREEIPIAARMFAIIDVWDALSSDRPYRKAWTKEAVLQHISDQSDKHFDPQVVEAFIRLYKKNTLALGMFA